MALTTDDQIEIVVHDDAAALRRLFTLPAPARLDALAAIRGVSSFDTAGMQMLRQIHEQGDGFRVAVDDPRYPAAVERLIEADAWGQMRRDLARAWEYQSVALPGIHHPDRIEVSLTLGYPDDPVFVEHTLGYYGMGATPGTIWLVAWPTDYNETRIGACAVHELAHNVRTPNIDGPFNLAEWVVHEGLAEVFTVEVCGPDSTGAWYKNVTGKVLDETSDKVIGAFGTGTTFQEWSPYVLGDEVARRLGREPVGVPHMGGYAVGRRIVEKYLDATGLKAAQAIARPVEELLEGAGVKQPST
ncbi:MAG TPA: DUF2268 domain-containing putative Zn-dependent protease [Candidatus Dormibacteraeota bacterium]|nr:DUF2268 domain-containing putative Zn-dependent protease [Candidatus Dormibacteraeota bacterium]